MSAYLRRHSERAHRCDRVNDARAEDFSANSTWAKLAARVKVHLAKLNELEVERENKKSQREQGTLGRDAARQALSDLVEATARTVEAMTPDHPDMKGMFERPAKDHSDQTLVATARSFAERAGPFVPLFVDYALPPTLVNDLRSGADTLDSSIDTQDKGFGGRIHANAGLREKLRALSEDLERMNVIYHNKYRDNPAVLAEWESAYHLEAAPRSKRKPKPDGNGTPPTDGTP